MLGFHISIYKLQSGNQPAPSASAPRGERLAVWQAGYDGLRWIDHLVEQGSAFHLGGFGYPTTYTARIGDLRPKVLAGPPSANEVWGYDPGDILLDGWCGKTTIDHSALSTCSPDEWVLLEAWDES